MTATMGLAFLAGASTSVGPCVAPRYLALAALAQGRPLRGRALLLAALCTGTLLGYSAFAAAGSMLAFVTAHSRWLYVLLAVSLFAGAIASLAKTGQGRCTRDGANPSLGGTFLLGVSSSLVISPCCTPALLAFGAAFAQGPFANALALVACFTAGHLAPTGLILAGSVVPASFAQRHASALTTVNAGLLCALGAYYGVLA